MNIFIKKKKKENLKGLNQIISALKAKKTLMRLENNNIATQLYLSERTRGVILSPVVMTVN